MTFSQRTTILSELSSEERLSAGTFAYLEERGRNSFYSYVMSKFREAEDDGLTKAKLARRMGKKPDNLSRILGSPGNWTIGMITALLAGICNEELIPNSQSFNGRASRNNSAKDLLRDDSWPSKAALDAKNISAIKASPPIWKVK